MLIRTPEYYSRFSCIADRCTDSCCAGWQVDVDDNSYAYYETVGGEFGERLHSVMIKGRRGMEGRFRIGKDGRCPFLNERNLCDLYTELGEDALCNTCDSYPRYVNDFGNTRELGIALSCVTAAELIMGCKGGPVFTEREDEDLFFSLNNIDGALYINLIKARKRIFDIIEERERPLPERLADILMYSKELEKNIKNPDCFAKLSIPQAAYNPDSVAGLFNSYWKYYLKQVIIKKEWAELGLTALDAFKNGTEDISSVIGYLDEYEREFMNIAEYFIFRYFLNAVNDGQILAAAKMCVVSILMILQTYYIEEKLYSHPLDFDKRVWLAHLYSREVEHSEENFANLKRIFIKKKEFSTESIIALLMHHC